MSEAKADATYRVGVDIGGTFTDLILVETHSGAITVGKSLTTPTDPSEAVEAVLRDALTRSGVAAAQVENIIHGTTLVTNSLIERKGSKTALLTTKGFRDAVEIGREHRYDLYDIFLEMPKPLVPRYLRLEVDERVLATGEVVTPPKLDEVEPLGAFTLVDVLVGDRLLRIDLPGQPHFAIGSPLALQARPESCHLFRDGDGQAIWPRPPR